MIEKFMSIFSRVAFSISLLLLVIAVWDWLIRYFGWRLSWNIYSPGRLIEFSGIFMVFVIAILLRQIRETMKAQNTKS
jgi:hypothetical protein